MAPKDQASYLQPTMMYLSVLFVNMYLSILYVNMYLFVSFSSCWKSKPRTDEVNGNNYFIIIN